ncbi:hypothetical protein EV421DRAFT_1935198 [Armillaria borealis]|uniref:Uncharacterized protein n=1 Tax=Armillaria borealis TaxID=47425 RepID=A0AA39JNN9_9AGAR|nr:hypothetical protein EV421DRAFT_1935198 [Armillaria borealis]
MQRTTDSLSKENERLSKIISELKEERDKFRQQTGKTRQELSQLLGEKERVDCDNADLKRTVLGLEERLEDSLIAHSEVAKVSAAAEAPTEAQSWNPFSPEQDPSTDTLPSKQEELSIVPASNSQTQGTIEEAPTLPNTSPTETTTTSTTIHPTTSDTTASSKLVLPSPSKLVEESAHIFPTSNVSTPVKQPSTSTSRCCGGQSTCCSPLAHAPPLRSALTTSSRGRGGIPTSSSHRIAYGSPPRLKRGYQESAAISPPKKRRV